MDNAKRDNEFFLFAIGLFDDTDDLDSETQVGDLYLEREGDRWLVYQIEQIGTDELQSYVDSIRPAAFPAARVLARYLQELEAVDGGRVDLPDDSAESVGESV